jgi:hypothetical protein
MSIEFVEKDCLSTESLVKPSRDVRIYVDTEKFYPDSIFQMYLQLEPEAICPKKDYLLKNYKKYDLILTFDKDVLKECSNAQRFTFYTVTWLVEDYYLNIDVSKKRFAISSLVGSKTITEGHRLRQVLYFSQKNLSQLPFTFYRSCQYPQLPQIDENPFLDSLSPDAKTVLFETYQFHLAIENSRQENYFTEKLIDCLISKTIPIYYGCPNIDEYFDTKGWILLETAQPMEVFVRCNELTSTYYNDYKETIEENYKRALLWKENYKRLNDLLLSIPFNL